MWNPVCALQSIVAVGNTQDECYKALTLTSDSGANDDFGDKIKGQTK